MNYSALIIENELITALMLHRILEEKGFVKIEIESKGDKGIDKALQTNPDLLITDAGLPGRGAFEIIRELKNNYFYSLPPVLIISGNQTHRHMLSTLELNSIDCISKPFSKEKINMFLNTTFRNYHNRITERSNG